MPTPHTHRVSARRATNAAFSLIELAVVVAIISIVVAIAVPTAKNLIFRARSSTVQSDLRVFTAAFQAYAQDKGDWPAGAGGPGEFPAGMEGFLGATNWQRVTPIGGHYSWDPNSLQQGARYRGVIGIYTTSDSPVTTDRNQLLDLDRMADDGNLATGNLLLGYRNYPIFVLEH